LEVLSTQLFQRSAVGSQLIIRDLFDAIMSAQRFLQESQRCLLVALLGDEALKHLTFVINASPEVVSLC
jgi:hypothetical protein